MPSARIQRGIFSGFYADTAKEVVFDTSRSWCSRLPALKTLFPDAKVIVCVREIAWVIDSIERLIQKNAFQPSSIFNFQTGGTVFTRANGVAAPDGLVGHAYDAVKEAFYGEEAHRLLLVLRLGGKKNARCRQRRCALGVHRQCRRRKHALVTPSTQPITVL
jgi:sulfotransferase